MQSPPQIFTLGPLQLEVEHREPGPAGGPTLRVRDAAGHQWLRFDAFLVDPHWHSDPDGPDATAPIPAPADTGEPIDTVVAWIRDDLTELLARAGCTEAPPPIPPEELAALERALRNPPAELDGLDPASLRLRCGEKWRTYPEDTLALWVADMDFPAADAIRRRLRQMIEWSDIGYPMHPAPTPLPQAFADRMQQRFGFTIDPSQVELLTEVVQGMYVVLETMTEPGDGVLVQTPIYPPFLSSVKEMKADPAHERIARGGGRSLRDRLRRARSEGGRLEGLLLLQPAQPDRARVPPRRARADRRDHDPATT